MIAKAIRFYKTQDKINFFCISLSFFIALVIIGLFIINLKNLPNKIPIFYSLSWGDEQLANSSQFIVLPLIIILTAMINLIISWHLHTSQVLLKKIIYISTLLISVLILLTSLRIIYIFV
ncbi:hypothetical protein HY025_01485 [Candidatus Daviesbacteria bacterium]|nr:hypothetical protein [Candidatus Daviesbacteria bacterium]